MPTRRSRSGSRWRSASPGRERRVVDRRDGENNSNTNSSTSQISKVGRGARDREMRRHSVLSEKVLLRVILRGSRCHGLEDPRPTKGRGQPNGGRRSRTRSRVRCGVIPRAAIFPGTPFGKVPKTDAVGPMTLDGDASRDRIGSWGACRCSTTVRSPNGALHDRDPSAVSVRVDPSIPER